MLNRIDGWQLFAFAILLLVVVSPISVAQDAAKKTRQLKRVARPEFDPQDWQGVFFEDVFRDALVGDRPAVTIDRPAGGGSTSEDVVKTWSNFVSAATIEDEVKLQQQELSRNITVAGRFRNNHDAARQAFQQLSLLFAIVREYNDKIRWKNDAGVAQRAFAEAAATAQTGSVGSFNTSRDRLNQLVRMVRGDRFSNADAVGQQVDWTNVIEHSDVMDRLQVLYDQLKADSGNEKQFKKRRAKIIHAAELIAAMAHTVQLPDMEYGQDDDYVQFAEQMKAAAINTARAGSDNNFKVMADAANRVGQSCTDCHAVFR